MKQIYLITLCLITFSFAVNAQTWDWTKTGPNGTVNNAGADGEDDAPYEIVTDANGFVYTLGDYNDSLYLNNNFITKGYGSYLAKYDITGNLIWYKLIRKTDLYLNTWGYNINTSDMVINSSGIFIVGYIPANPYNIPVTYEIGSSSFTVDTTGRHIYGATNEFFICKLNFNGTVVWNKTSRNAGGLGNNYRPTITSDNNNNIIVSGFKGNNLCGSCGNYQTTFYTGTDAVTDNTGRLYRSQIFILKYSATGNFLWSSYIKDDLVNAGAGYPVSLACDNSNNIWLYASTYSGSYFNNIQFTSTHGTLPFTVLTKLNSGGSVQLVKEISTYSLNDRVYRFGKPQLITFDNADNLYALVNLSNQPNSYLDGNIPVTNSSQKIYLLKYNNTANLIWYKTFGGKQDDYSSDIKFYNNALWYTGSIRSSYSYPDTSYFKFDPLTVPDKRITLNFLKFFAAKSDTAGNFNWVTTFSGSGGMIGLGIAPTISGVYTSCSYVKSINDLGSLGGSFTNPDISILNQFFGKLKDEYIRVGAVTPTQLIPGCTITVPFTSTGLTLSAGNTFTAELSNATGDFTTPTVIGTTTSTGTGSITATIPANLNYSSGYRIRIQSSDTLKTGYNYYAYADTGYKLSLVCPSVVSGFTTTNITGTSATVSWATVACASGYRVQYRVRGTSAWTTLNISTNTPILNITGLAINTIYQWKVSTKCRNNGVNSFSAYSAIKQFTTLSSFAADENVSGIQSTSANGISIGPNPAKNQLRINLTNLKTIVQSLQVLNAGGIKVAEKTFSTNNYGKLSIDVSGYAPGLYMLLLKTNKGVITNKFIKE